MQNVTHKVHINSGPQWQYRMLIKAARLDCQATSHSLPVLCFLMALGELSRQ